MKHDSDKSGWISPLKPISPFDIPSETTDERQSLVVIVPLSLKCIPLLHLEVSSNPGASSVTLAQENLTNEASGSDPDLLVLGFQELDLSTEALLYATSTLREDAWVSAILAGLGEKGILYEKVLGFLRFLCRDLMNDVCQLASKQLVGMLIIAIVKKSRLSYFSDITLSAAGAGIMGVMVQS
jgi:phosphatidylinositol-bisphosphatase